MYSFNRFFGCLLVGLLGLVFTGPVFAAATVSANEGAAAVACSAVASVQTGVSSKCVSKSLTPYTFGGSTYYGAYFCINLRGSGTSWSVRYCSANGSAGSSISIYSGSNAQAQAQAFYDSSVPPASITSVSQVYSSDPSAFFIWKTPTPDCSSASSFLSTTLMADTPNGSGNACHNGCQYSVAVGYVGTYPSGYLEFDFAPTGSACSPSDSAAINVNDGPEDINTDQDGDGKKDGDDPCPNDPTDTCNIPDDSKDTDGDGKPDYQDPYPNDPTNGKGDGSGSGDGNTSSGGGDCVAPPSCGGDAIQCNILFQTWAHRCGKTGGTAGEGPTGPGSPGGGGDNSDVVSELQGLRSDLEDSLSGSPGDTDMSGFNGTREWGVGDLDQSGLGFPRTCPMWSDVSFSIGPSSITLPFSSFALHCQIFEWTGLLIISFAGFWSVRYLIGG